MSIAQILKSEEKLLPSRGEHFGPASRYGIAVGAVGLALLTRLALDRFIGHEVQPYITIYFATAMVAWWIGLRPALVTLVLGLVCCWWLIVPPRNSPALRELKDIVEILICLLVAMTIIFLVLMTRLTLADKLRAEAARKEIELAHRHTRMILESIRDAFTSLDKEWKYTYANPAAGQLLRRPPDELIGTSFWEEWPNIREGPYGEQLRKAASENAPVQLELFWPAPVNRWIEMRCYPSTEGVSLFFTDISDRKDHERVLIETKNVLATSNSELENVVKERTEELEEAASELQLISYALAHDMRAPLRAMSGFATLVEKECVPGGNLRASELCGRIIRGADRLDRLIVDSLNYMKSLHEKLPVEDIDLSSFIPDLIQSYPNLNEHAEQIEIVQPLPKVLGSKAPLTQCFANLLGNGVKFVAPGVRPHLKIWAEFREQKVRIWVQDNGIGIAREHQERIFDLFQQLNGSFGGTGIGLAVVKKTVQRLGGIVGVESELGRGSRFWVELQMAKLGAHNNN